MLKRGRLMSEQRCETCQCWEFIEDPAERVRLIPGRHPDFTGDAQYDVLMGLCQRYPPKNKVFNPMATEEWCGEWREREQADE